MTRKVNYTLTINDCKMGEKHPTYKPRYSLKTWLNKTDYVEKYFGAIPPEKIDIDMFAQAVGEKLKKDTIDVTEIVGYVYDPTRAFYGNEFTGGTWIETEDGWAPYYDI